MNIGFIGCGQMASALVIGTAQHRSVSNINAYDPNPVALKNWSEILSVEDCKFTSCDSNQAVVDASDYIFLAVKPQVVAEALDGIKVVDSKLFVSIVAGISIRSLQQLLNADRVVRTMPNTPCLIGHGAIAVATSGSVEATQLGFIQDVFNAIGSVVEVPERCMDAVTGLSGSGPAYVYTFIESMVDAGVLAGLPRDISRQLTLQTVLGATQMVANSGENPSVLRDRVTSPGGTTIHGMEQLEQNGFRGSILAAVNAATKRSAELGQ